MVDKIIIICFILMLIVGLLIEQSYLSNTKKELEYTQKYKDFFVQITNKIFSNKKLTKSTNTKYEWLVKNIDNMQSKLGYFGILAFYSPPYTTYKISNYRVLDIILNIRNNKITTDDVFIVDDCMTRYMGNLEKRISIIKKNLKNPIIWFKNSSYEIIIIPLTILKYLSILNDDTIKNFTSKKIINFIIKVFQVIGFFGSIITISLGYEDFIRLIQKFFLSLFL
jgi:hypothetical protein